MFLIQYIQTPYFPINVLQPQLWNHYLNSNIEMYIHRSRKEGLFRFGILYLQLNCFCRLGILEINLLHFWLTLKQLDWSCSDERYFKIWHMISLGNLSNGFETILKLEISIVNLRKIMTKSSICNLVVSCQRGSDILNVRMQRALNLDIR